MKSSFWLSSLTVIAYEREKDSTVTFKPGLNVIYGPSNTGKTWILKTLDYALGSDPEKMPITEQMGYTHVRLTINTDRGIVQLTRPIGTGHNTLEVSSTNPRINVTQCKARSRTKTLPSVADVLLRLIGFDYPEDYKLLASTDLKTQVFSWRTFWHLLFANEGRVGSEKSVFLNPDSRSPLPTQTALTTLFEGTNYAQYAAEENIGARKLKTKTIIEYLRPQPAQIDARIQSIEKILAATSEEQLVAKINEFSIEAQAVSQQLDQYTARSQQLIQEIGMVNASLAEIQMLRSQYQDLGTSYRAKIERLEFIEAGHKLTDQHPAAANCPVCGQVVPEDAQERFTPTTQVEKRVLVQRLAGLEDTLAGLAKEEQPLLEQQAALRQKATSVADFIAKQLQPRFSELKQQIADYKATIELKTEREQLLERKKDIEDEIREKEAIKFDKPDLGVERILPKEFWEIFSNYLLDTLGAFAYPNLNEAYLSKETFDAVVNKKLKKDQGHGYRSLIDTGMLMSLRNYFASEHSKHNPSMLIIDKPLVGLDDPQENPELNIYYDKITEAVYEYFTLYQDKGQIIIVDNPKTMADISVIEGKANIIRFTKKTNEGRYGFLVGQTDTDIVSAPANEETEPPHAE